MPAQFQSHDGLPEFVSRELETVQKTAMDIICNVFYTKKRLLRQVLSLCHTEDKPG